MPQAHPWRLLVQSGVVSILPTSPATALTRKMPRSHRWAKPPSWAGLHWSPHSWARRGRLDPYQHLPFHWRNWFPFPTCDLELVQSHTCLQKDTPIQAITKVQTVPLARCQYANNTYLEPLTLFPSMNYQDQVLLFGQLRSFILEFYFKHLEDGCFKKGVKILITDVLRGEQEKTDKKCAAT